MKKTISIVLIAALIILNSAAVAFAGDVYTVQPGDKLWKIAQKYDISWQALAEHNSLKNPDLIFPNQKLNIPDRAAAPAEKPATPVEKPTAPAVQPAVPAAGADDKADYEGRPVAAAPTGTYVGKDNNGVAEFLGIRYAAPIERWKAPKDVTTTGGSIIEAAEWGPSCIQPYDDVEIASQWKQDEDCLTLNVWTKDLKTTNKPVMVFIHGGGATQGGSYDPLYDGEEFIRNLGNGEDAVLVTINYRLGIFGSLDLSALDGYTQDYQEAVNLAILDQIQALKWVSGNIGAWGGDSRNVTVFGQSAGGGAICTLLTMPEATQYFQKAILESGILFNRQCSPEKLKENSRAVFDTLGVTSIDELMAISDDKIYENYIDTIFDEVSLQQRVADGAIIPEDGWNALVGGSARGIQIMIGTTDGEYDFYATDWDNFPNAITDPDYIWGKIEKSKESKGDVSTVLSPVGYPEAVKEYLALGKDQVKRMQDLYNDIHYRQGSIYVAETLSKYTDVYMYYWTWAPEPQDVIELMGEAAEVSPYGRAMHCMDLVFVFGTTAEGYPELAGPGDKIPKKLVEQTQAAYYAFARAGDPNNALIPTWKTYNPDTRYTMVIGGDGAWQLVGDPRSEDRIILDQIRPLTEK